MNSWKSIFADNHAKIITVLAAVLVAGIVGAVVLANSQQDFLAKSPGPATSNPSTTTKTTNTPLNEAPVTDDAPRQSQPASSNPQPYTTTQPRHAFSIGYVSLVQPQSKCGGPDIDIISIQDATMTFPPNTDGGNVTYSFTVTGASNSGGGAFTVPANVTSGSINQFRGSSTPIFYISVPVPHPSVRIQLALNGKTSIGSEFSTPPRNAGECS